MFKNSMVFAASFGACFLIAACTGDESPNVPDERSAPAQQQEATNGTNDAAPKQTTPVVENGDDDDDVAPPAEEPPAEEPAADAGADSGPKVPVVKLVGKVHATNSTDIACTWSIDGLAKGMSVQLDASVLAGKHVVACERFDGAIAKQEDVAVQVGKTTEVDVAFKPMIPGTLSAKSMGGSCEWDVNGKAVGESSDLELSVQPGTYLVTCTPAKGVPMTKSVDVASEGTGTVKFDL